MALTIACRLKELWKNPGWQLAFLFALVFCSRLPFVDAGYGVNIDAWRVARVAREIALSGEYSVSRFPGYPVQEIVCSWFWQGGPVALNLLTALFSAVAVTAFAAIGRKLEQQDWWLSALALAAVPVFFVNSVTAKDYVWAVAFILLSILAALHNKAFVAGLLLGLATGCRITSLAMVLPIGLILLGQSASRTSLLRFALSALATAAFLFTPVWSRYGLGFFTFYENHARPDWAVIINRGLIEVWGSLGLIGLTSASGALILYRRKITNINKPIAAALSCAIAIYLAAYLRLPDQAGYLLPIVPCVLLLLNPFVPRRIWQTACLFLFLSPLIDFSAHGFTSGAILADRAERLNTMTGLRDFLLFSEALPGRNTILVGGWEPQIAVLAPSLVRGRNHYVYALNADEATICRQKEEPIFYVPPMREFNYRVTGVDVARFGARDLHELFVRGRNAATRAGP